MFFMMAPHRIEDGLADVEAVFGLGAALVIAREPRRRARGVS